MSRELASMIRAELIANPRSQRGANVIREVGSRSSVPQARGSTPGSVNAASVHVRRRDILRSLLVVSSVY